jgi:polyisoprenyl-phosphate glycosyltransferase
MNERLAIVVPVYNEAGVIGRFHARLLAVLQAHGGNFHIYYVNDGSTDSTQAELQEIAADERVTVIELSRNFGHQAALSAGMDLCEGDVMISLDGDGQHPPELIPELLALHHAGYDIVITHRADVETTGFFKRWSASAFYTFINHIGDTHVSPGSSDFRLMSRPALDALKQMPEYHRFLRGMVGWLGFKSVVLPYTPDARMGGTSKYSLKKMLALASDAIFSFSLVPIRAVLALGGLFLLLALAEVIYVLSFWVRGLQDSLAPGWSSLMFVILFTGGAVMVSLGVIGMYIGYIFQQVKGRPPYVVRAIATPNKKDTP